MNEQKIGRLERFMQTLDLLGKILSYFVLPFSLYGRYKRIKIADECISISGDTDLIKKSKRVRGLFLMSAITYSIISLTTVFGGAGIVYHASQESIHKVLEKKRFSKQSSAKTKKFLIKKLNTGQNHLGLALFLSGIILNLVVINSDRYATKTALLRRFLVDKQSSEYEGTKSFYCYGGYVVYITTQTHRDIAENKSLWAAMGTTASVDSTLSHPTNRKIAMFRQKFELKDAYVF